MAEPEWDDATRALAQGLARKERETCPGCGLHSSILADPHRHRFTFDERLCAVCAAQDVFDRSVKKREEKTLKSLEDAPPTVPRPGDGRYFYLRTLTDEEREKEESRGRPPGKRPH